MAAWLRESRLWCRLYEYILSTCVYYDVSLLRTVRLLISAAQHRFAKGPLYFLSRSLILEVLGSAWLWTDLNATLDSADAQKQTPYEDVYTGCECLRVYLRVLP